jgi:hypothetical protein
MPATPKPDPKPFAAPLQGLSPAGDDDDEFDVLVDSQFFAPAGPDAAGAAAEPTAAPAATPHAWQFGLIGLLAELESLRLQFAGCRYSTDTDHLLDRIEAMVQLTEEFSRLYDFPDASVETQMTALAKAGTFYAVLNDTRHTRPATNSLFKNVIAKMSSAEPVPGAAVRECLALGLETLHAHFSLFTEMYRSSIKARNWVDAASSFLADFKQMARAIPEA